MRNWFAGLAFCLIVAMASVGTIYAQTTFMLGTNLAEDALNGAINDSVTSLDLDSAAKFPATETFMIRIESEIMEVSGVSTNTFTVVRAQGGTIATSHADDEAVYLVVEWGYISEIQDAVNVVETRVPNAHAIGGASHSDVVEAGIADAHVYLYDVGDGRWENKAITGPLSLTAEGVSSLDLTEPGAIGSVTPNTGDFTSLGATLGVTINESGTDSDTRVEGDTDINLLFVDASTDRVGIGTNTPQELFDVDGVASIFSLIVNPDGDLAGDMRVESDNNLNMLRTDAENDRVGIGIAAPAATLDVNGDLLISGGKLRLGIGGALEISSGVITVTHSFHRVDTESAAATDDLDNILGGVAGDVLVLIPTDGDRDITFKNGSGGSGQIYNDGFVDKIVPNTLETISYIRDTATDRWIELSNKD